MQKENILTLFQYNHWANAKILDAATNVTQEQYLAPASFPHGGLQGTLVHTLFAEWLWRQRWEGRSPTVRFKPEEFPTLDALRARWAKEEIALMSFVDGLADDQLTSYFGYKNTKGVLHRRILWQAMAHVVNHGTQHRSEAAAILTDFGTSPGDLDLIYFFD